MSKDRKPRTDKIKNVDLLFPVKLEDLGTESDPCFSVLYDPRTPECSRCGDSELCAMAMNQKNAIKRGKLEAENNYKDLEEEGLQEPDPLIIRKLVKKRFKEVIKLSKDGVTREYLIADVYALFFDRGYTKEKLGKILDRLKERTDLFTYKNNIYKWKQSLKK